MALGRAAARRLRHHFGLADPRRLATASAATCVGDLQGLNNIEADAGWYLYDLWSEVSFGPRQGASVRAGLLDLNAEFDTSDTAGFFVSPPFGIGTDLAQTGANGPAVFPVTGAGPALRWRARRDRCSGARGL